MDKVLWRLLMWTWTRRAKRAYGGPGENGAMFNTACFQGVVLKTTGVAIGGAMASEWLFDYGMIPGVGWCHWFTNGVKAEATFGDKS